MKGENSGGNDVQHSGILTHKLCAFACLTLVTTSYCAPAWAEERPSAASPANLPDALVDIDESNVDLMGAGRLEFEGDGDAITALVPRAGKPEVRLQISFNRGGAAIACVSKDVAERARLATALCGQVMQRARFNLRPGFDLPFHQGVLKVVVVIDRMQRPQRPIRFIGVTSVKDSLDILSPGPGPQGKACDLYSLTLSVTDREAICAAWLQAGKPGLHGQAARVQVALGRRADDADSKYVVWAHEEPLWMKRHIQYLAPRPPHESYLAPSDGRIATTLAPGDYPTMAMRYGVEGTPRIVMGFDRTGAALTCRPVESSGTAFLDNETCRSMLRHARFAFTEAAPQFSGVRYYEASVKWVLPGK